MRWIAWIKEFPADVVEVVPACMDQPEYSVQHLHCRQLAPAERVQNVRPRLLHATCRAARRLEQTALASVPAPSNASTAAT